MPPPFKIEYLPTAQKDLEEIFNYIANDNREAAIQILDEYDAFVLQLEQNPLLGLVPKNAKLERLGYRQLNVKNYFVYYVVGENRVEIRRIIHGWNPWEKSGTFERSIIGQVLHKDMMERLKNKINASQH
jgi:toxin ParE1/3/4